VGVFQSCIQSGEYIDLLQLHILYSEKALADKIFFEKGRFIITAAGNRSLKFTYASYHR